MNFLLPRYKTGDHGTFGVLVSEDGLFRCHTIECPWKNNKVNISCIPAGIYNVVPYTSRRFGKVWEVEDVPGRTYILFHPANFAGDVEKGLSSQLRGCISPGRVLARLTARGGREQEAVGHSRHALADLMDHHGWNPFTLKILDL